ncbi:MAG: methyltransferase domain-containing protein [Cyanobacteria bacterium J06598_3]
MSVSNYERTYKKTVVDFFDGRTRYDNTLTLRRALPLLEMVSLEAGQQVLDVATGTGIIAIAAAQKVGPTGQVTGIDFSSGMLHQARQKSDQLGLHNIDWVEADADYANFEPDSFDTIFCSSAIVYFKDIAQTLQSWHRWLKPNGAAIFSGWSEQSYPAPWIIESCARHDITIDNINAPTGTPERCVALMETAGFKNVIVHQHQLGTYRTVEQLSGWNGSWFHPHANPLADVPSEQRQQIIADYHRSIATRATDAGVWCESLAYYVVGQKR